MSEGSTLLVWARAEPSGEYEKGYVIDVRPGRFDFGSEIPRLGWWRVLHCTATISEALGFAGSSHGRSRHWRLNLDRLPEGDEDISLDLLTQIAEETPMRPGEIAGPENVIG